MEQVLTKIAVEPENSAQSAFADRRWDVDLGGIRVVFGDGEISRLGELARELGGNRALIVTDSGIVSAGHVAPAVGALESAGLKVEVFDGVAENPTTDHVQRGVETASTFRADLLIGLGGGSSMDCAKGINFLVSNGGSMEDYWGEGKAAQPMLPSIGIPTTCGTGSEGQRFALISQSESHTKMACGDRKARFRTVVLDPHLVSSMPREVAAVTGVDALSHAVESYVTKRRNPISSLFALESWRLIESSFERFLDDPGDRDARARMLLAAHLGGAAIEASMLGAAHSCANPLTARHGLTHGVAIGLMLPHVVRFNGVEVDDLYRDLATSMTSHRSNHRQPSVVTRRAALTICQRISDLRAAANLPASLSECGVTEADIPALAAAAAREWTAQFNPRSLAPEDFESLYHAAL